MTPGQIIGLFFIVLVCLAGIGTTIWVSYNENNKVSKRGLAIALVSSVIVIGLSTGLMLWYNTTASGQRYVKDWQSELDNGIEREITIYAEDGREIFYYEGKVDIESDHEDNYIKFEGEDGKRYIIYYGIQDTVEIIEK